MSNQEEQTTVLSHFVNAFSPADSHWLRISHRGIRPTSGELPNILITLREHNDGMAHWYYPLSNGRNQAFSMTS